MMRDHPAHYGQMLAGLWGGHNYHNLSLAAQLSQALFSRPATGEYTSDQRALEEAVWHSALIHDCYRCLASHRARYGQVVPFPTRRAGGSWTGSGPARAKMLREMEAGTCPRECRPPQHKDEWTNC